MNKQLRVFVDIAECFTLQSAFQKQGRRIQEDDLSRLSNAVLVSLDGRVVWIGREADFSESILDSWGGRRAAEYVSLQDRVVIPGFVEAHTHLIFAGHRSHEFEWRMQGQTYQQIAAKGGGIRHTVNETRQASSEKLRELAQERVDRFLAQGVTTLEVKSGYGLDLETELRSLSVARELVGPRIVTTYLGAHSRSPEIPDFEQYMRFMCDEVLPQVAQAKVADRVDIYVESGFFTPELARTYCRRARELGMALTAHVEQLSNCGGAAACLEFQPQSLDHLVFADDGVIAALAQSSTTAVLLPTSDFYLRMQYPRARHMLDSGVRVALSSDFNPGTSPTQDLSLVGVLARLEMKMSLAEVLCAFTLNASYALGLESEIGSLTIGKYADFSVLEGSWQELFYGVGQHPVIAVFRAGERLDEI